jgi:hypothetical protein
MNAKRQPMKPVRAWASMCLLYPVPQGLVLPAVIEATREEARRHGGKVVRVEVREVPSRESRNRGEGSKR